jgi:hypothetical protein
MSVVQLPLRRAWDIEPMSSLPLKAVKTLAMQYWRRTQYMKEPAHRLPSLAVFDDSLMASLASIKTHLLYAPELEALLHQELQVIEKELDDARVSVFSFTCLHILKHQLNPALGLPLKIWDTYLLEQPDAIYDALRFCFTEAVAQYLTKAVDHAFDHGLNERAYLLTRLAIARPAVSDVFSQSVANNIREHEDGLAALCQLRCLMDLDESKAKKAIEDAQHADAGLIALSLGNSSLELEMACAMLRAGSTSHIALAIVAGQDVAWIDRQNKGQPGLFDQLPLIKQLYAAGLMGHVPTLKTLAEQLDWSQSIQCRALADAAELISGADVDFVFDFSIPAPERKQRFDTFVSCLPVGEALRLNQPREQVSLRDSVIHAGVELRAMLYMEYATRHKSSLWIEADDLASVQSLAVVTGTIFQQAFSEGSFT